MSRLCKFWKDGGGATAAEFALLVPALSALTIGAINLCLLVYANSLLQYAVDDAARCEAVKTNVCVSDISTQNHAKATFGFANLNPIFSAGQAECGYQVSGTVTYPLTAVVTNIPVPISANSCYPVQD